VPAEHTWWSPEEVPAPDGPGPFSLLPIAVRVHESKDGLFKINKFVGLQLNRY
jgi:hypothetical protein